MKPSVRHSNNTNNESTTVEATVEKTSFIQPPGSIGYRTGLVLNSTHLNSKMSSKCHPNEHHMKDQSKKYLREEPCVIAISSNLEKGNNLPSMMTRSSSSSVDLLPSSSSHDNINIPLTQKEELSRFRRQFFFECTSLALMTLAGTIIVILPFLMMSVWLVPLKYARTVRIILAGCFGISILLVICAGFLGNIYWYMDPIKRKWKWGLHCGSGPSDHYWGETLFYTDSSKEYPGTSTNHLMINHHQTSYLPPVNGKNRHHQGTSNLPTYYANGQTKEDLMKQLHVNLP